MTMTSRGGTTPKWLVPALVVVATVLLIGIVWLINSPADGGGTGSADPQTPAPTDSAPTDSAPTQPSAEGAPTEVQGPQVDLTAVERRDEADLLTAGPVDAPVTLVVFSDYQCGFCARWSHETLPLMLESAEAGDLRIEWRDVNIFGEDSERAALASYAAAKQGAFWEYHQALFPSGQKISNYSEESLVAIAGELGLDTAQFAADLSSEDAAAEIARNAQLGHDLGAFSTPAFIFGGTPIVGAQPTDVFTDALANALANAG